MPPKNKNTPETPNIEPVLESILEATDRNTKETTTLLELSVEQGKDLVETTKDTSKKTVDAVKDVATATEKVGEKTHELLETLVEQGKKAAEIPEKDPNDYEVKVHVIKGDKGEPGKDCDETKVIETVTAEVKKSVPTPEQVLELAKPIIKEAIPAPIPGKKGDKGDSCEPEEVASLLKNDASFIQKSKGIPGEPGKDGSPDTGEAIISKIRNLKPGEGLKSDDIADLQEVIRRNKNMLGYLRELSDVEIIGEPNGVLVLTWSPTKHKWVAQAASGGAVPIAVDISDQFDGVETTFTLPAYSAILMFNITGWPPNGALRQTVDFTTPSSTTVALTSEVSAPASGATGIVLIIPA